MRQVSNRPLTVKISGFLFNSTVGWSFGEAQLVQNSPGTPIPFISRVTLRISLAQNIWQARREFWRCKTKYKRHNLGGSELK